MKNVLYTLLFLAVCAPILQGGESAGMEIEPQKSPCPTTSALDVQQLVKNAGFESINERECELMETITPTADNLTKGVIDHYCAVAEQNPAQREFLRKEAVENLCTALANCVLKTPNTSLGKTEKFYLLAAIRALLIPLFGVIRTKPGVESTKTTEPSPQEEIKRVQDEDLRDANTIGDIFGLILCCRSAATAYAAQAPADVPPLYDVPTLYKAALLFALKNHSDWEVELSSYFASYLQQAVAHSEIAIRCESLRLSAEHLGLDLIMAYNRITQKGFIDTYKKVERALISVRENSETLIADITGPKFTAAQKQAAKLEYDVAQKQIIQLESYLQSKRDDYLVAQEEQQKIGSHMKTAFLEVLRQYHIQEHSEVGSALKHMFNEVGNDLCKIYKCHNELVKKLILENPRPSELYSTQALDAAAVAILSAISGAQQ